MSHNCFDNLRRTIVTEGLRGVAVDAVSFPNNKLYKHGNATGYLPSIAIKVKHYSGNEVNDFIPCTYCPLCGKKLELEATNG